MKDLLPILAVLAITCASLTFVACSGTCGEPVYASGQPDCAAPPAVDEDAPWRSHGKLALLVLGCLVGLITAVFMLRGAWEAAGLPGVVFTLIALGLLASVLAVLSGCSQAHQNALRGVHSGQAMPESPPAIEPSEGCSSGC